jgi:SulP family sulfate permease
MQALIGPAFTIALLGAIESLLSAVVADGMANTRHDSNQELLGQGIANMVAPLFGGIAATGAIARTATNIRNGANSPLCALAAILFVVAWNMSEPHRFIAVLKTAPTADRAIMVITFLLTIFTDLVVAVNVGVLLAILQFLRRMTESVETLAVDPDSLQRELAESGITQLPDKVLVFETAGPLFFAAAENLEQVLLQTSTDPAVIILRLRQVPFLDITGIQALERVVHKLSARNVDVVLCEANPRVLAKLQKAGILHSKFRYRCANGLAEAIACSM